MKTPMSLLLIFSAFFMHAQVVFCPPGAVWTAYYKNTIFSSSLSNSAVVYYKDSIVGADTLKVLLHSKFFNQCNPYSSLTTFVKQKGDTIFIKNVATQNTWQIWVNYACAPTQTWSTTYTISPSGTLRSYIYTVDSTDTVLENGFNLKRLFTRYSINGDVVTTPLVIYERYGFGFPFQYWGRTSACDGDGLMGSLCYGDATFGTKLFSQLPCGFSNPSGLAKQNISTERRVYPNPSSGIVKVEGLYEGLVISVFELSGKCVKKVPVSAENTFDVSDLDQGIYFLSTEDGQLNTKIILSE